MKKQKKIKTQISNQPYAIPIEMRPLWRICLIVISVGIVSGQKKYLDLKKVNILVWMLIRNGRWKEYENYLLGRTPGIPLVSVDTSTYKAIEFSIAKNFIKLENKRLFITKSGEELYDILKQNEIMVNERKFLKSFGKKLSEKKVKGLTGGII